jgi:hypothetical protein
MKVRSFIAGLLILGLSACAATTRFDAAGDVHAFLVAVRDGDKAGFEAHVDRDALKTNLRARIIAETTRRRGAGSVEAAGALLASPLLAGVAVDLLVRPEVFKAAAERLGYSSSRPIPDRLTIASGLRYVDQGRVCAARSKKDPCLFVFRNDMGVWKLVAYEGELKF